MQDRALAHDTHMENLLERGLGVLLMYCRHFYSKFWYNKTKHSMIVMVTETRGNEKWINESQ
jgi:hypothetical protein